MLKKLLEAKGVEYERKGKKLVLTFRYESDIFFAMKRILVEECGITLGDDSLFGVYGHNEVIILKDHNFSTLQLNEQKIISILETEQIFEKIVFEERMARMDKKKEEAKYFKEKAIQVFASKRELAKKFLIIQPLYYDRSRMWWIWSHEEMRWNITDETDILNLIDQHATINTIQSKERVEILEALRQEGRLNKPKDLENTWIQFKDTIMDVKTGGTFEASARYFAVNPIPWKLGDTEDTPNIDRLFAEWVGEEKAVTLKEICAYCFLPDYPLHHIFAFIGAGRNGKSKFLGFISRLIGANNSCTVDFDNLMKNQFEGFSLYKKLVCQMGETDFATASKTSKLKRLSGQDMIKFESKGKDAVEGYNYAKLLIATNHLPDTTDKTEGWYRRWVIIDFPNKFEEGRDPLASIPDEEYENFCAKCARMLRELLKRGKFQNVGTIEQRQEAYESRSNPFDKFVADEMQITHDRDEPLPKWKFKTDYEAFLVAHGFNKSYASDAEISKRMKSLGLEDGRPWFEGLPYLEQGQKKKWSAWYGIENKDLGQPGQPGQPTLGSNPYREIKSIPPVQVVQPVQTRNYGAPVYENADLNARFVVLAQYLSAKKEAKKVDLEIICGKEFVDRMIREGKLMETKPGILVLTK